MTQRAERVKQYRSRQYQIEREFMRRIEIALKKQGVPLLDTVGFPIRESDVAVAFSMRAFL